MNVENIKNHLKTLQIPRKQKKTDAPETADKTKKISFTRVDELITSVSWDDNKGIGYLNNSNWAYDVSYAFRDALDIKRLARIKTEPVIDKETNEPVLDEETGKKKTIRKTKYVWTQGFCIHFKDGDLLRSSKGFPTIQVQSSTPMSWDEDDNKMFDGVVNYEYFEKIKFGSIGDIKTLTQMEFLMMLVFGEALVSRTM